MSARNLAWLRTEVSRKLNHNSGQTNQDFAGTTDDTNADLDAFIGEAYDQELEEAMQEAGPDLFAEYSEHIWAASSATFTLPDHLAEADILLVEDVTNDSTGSVLWVTDKSEHYKSEIFPLDRKTWQWGSDGPGSATTIRFTFLPEANELTQPADEPRYIPSRFRWLLVWAAAIIGREDADEQAPAAWMRARDYWRARFHISIGKGRPRGTNRWRLPPLGDVYS